MKKNQKGQTLVIIIVLMVLALSVGVVVSSRFIKGIRNITQTDNSSKALSVAEAAIERMLIIPNDTLESYINFNNCGSACVLEINGAFGQSLRADVTLSYAGNSEDIYETRVKENEVAQISLNGYQTDEILEVCWDSNSSLYASYIYEESGEIKTDIYAYNPVSYTGEENGFLESSANHGYPNCFSVNTSDTPRYLRIKPYYSDAYLYIVPTPGQLIPSQGIYITSIGKAGNAVKTVKVLKTSSMVPEYFDYVIYQKSLTEPLSNRPD